MAKPNSRQTLIDYCLRSLGAPVIEINVDDDQLDDRLDEALQFYQEYHGDAVHRVLKYHKLTQEEFDRANDSPAGREGDTTDSGNNAMYIDIGNTNMLSINRIVPLFQTGHSANMFSIDYQLHLNDIFDLGGPYGGGLVNYEITKQYMSLIDRNINGLYEPLEYQRHKNKVYFYTDGLRGLNVGDVVIFDGYEIVNPDDHTDVWIVTGKPSV